MKGRSAEARYLRRTEISEAISIAWGEPWIRIAL